MKPRIAIVSGDYPPAISGIGDYVEKLAGTMTAERIPSSPRPASKMLRPRPFWCAAASSHGTGRIVAA